MRLCDEYVSRVGLAPLFLRHSSRSFLFFDYGVNLLSIKWLNSSDSSGSYEFVECVLGSVVKSLKRHRVEWSSYEEFLGSWLDSNGGFVLEEERVFSLVWNFFIVRNDYLLSKTKNPFVIHRSLSDIALARRIADESSIFWEGKFGDILRNYAYWVNRKV